LAAKSSNPAAPTFDVAGSDVRAVAIADRVMDALGGRAAWDGTRCIEWTFAGRRKLLWDKQTGDLRLENGPRVVLMNMGMQKGRVFENGTEVTDPAKVREALDNANKIWINDSYWLFAPYKLKDSGVTLTYAGERALPDGRPADVLHLQFANVGVTPDNCYDMWIARDTQRLEQWAYFEHRGDEAAKMTTPWTDWKQYGGIWLASGHGKGPATSEIAVYAEPPARLTQL
jgi:hypothetical protein